MRNSFNVGITVHNFENDITLSLLRQLTNHNIKIDFIIYHQCYFKRKILELINAIFNKRRSDELKELLKKNIKVKIYNSSDINSSKTKKIFNSHINSLVFCNTGIIKQKTIKDNPKIILLNIHESKLPNYRGVSNVNWALWDKEDIYVTIHRINNGIDEGDVLYQKLLIKFQEFIKKKSSYTKLYELSHKAACEAIIKYQNAEIDFHQQDFIGNKMKRYYSMHPILKKILNENLK